MDIQPGDVPATHADTSSLEEYIGFRPNTSTKEGVTPLIFATQNNYIEIVLSLDSDF